LEQKWPEEQALWRSRGGFAAKILARSDASGDIRAFDLTRSKSFAGRHFETMLDVRREFSPAPSSVSRQGLEEASHRSPHSPQSQQKRRASFLRPHLYRARARIDQGLGRLKRFKRFALRCESTAPKKLKISWPMLDQIRPPRLRYASGTAPKLN
jgi:transposase